MTWSLIVSKAGDLVLIQTSLLFICKCKLDCIRTAWATYEKQWGLYQDKVTPNLASNPRSGHLAHNCKMGYGGVRYQYLVLSVQFIREIGHRKEMKSWSTAKIKANFPFHSPDAAAHFFFQLPPPPFIHKLTRELVSKEPVVLRR